jgi:beta-lactamase regulating signal transducer with metallopeptidase domain
MNQLTVLFTQPWAERLGWTLVHFIWQGAAIGLALAIARIWMTSARSRHSAACIALAAMSLSPLATLAWLNGHDAAPASVTPALVFSQVPTPAGPVTAVAPGLLPWVVAVWLAGVVLLSMRLAGGWISAARLRYSGARPAPEEWQTLFEDLVSRMDVGRGVRLMVSPHVDVPAVLGWVRPIVLAPVAALTGLPLEHAEALLAHELAHIRRNDYLINLLQGVVETVLFYHPAVWWVSAQIRTEREHCCDDLAIATTTDVLTYARALAELETCRTLRARTAIAADGGSLLHRVARLVDPARKQHTLPRPAAAWALSALLAVGIGIFATRVTLQAQTYPTVEKAEIWTDTVQKGDLQVEVRGLGKLISPNLAEVRIAETQAKELRPGQAVSIDYRGGQLLPGSVTKIHPTPENGTILVDVTTAALPPSAGRPPIDIDATIHIRTIPNVVYIHRPVFGKAYSADTVYRIEPDGTQAVRVNVQYGASSVNTIEVLGGLVPGDKVILSEVKTAKAERINLK